MGAKVKNYKVSLFPPRRLGGAFSEPIEVGGKPVMYRSTIEIYLEDGHLVTAFFITEDTPVPPQPHDRVGGWKFGVFPSTMLHHFIDVLRNEEPLWVWTDMSPNPAPGYSSRWILATGAEPAGEGEHNPA